MLRTYFKYELKLLTQFCYCAKESLQMFFRTVLDLDKKVLRMMKEIYTLTKQYARKLNNIYSL